MAATIPASYTTYADVQRVKTIVNRLIDHVALSGDKQTKTTQLSNMKPPILRPRMNIYECTKSNSVVATLELPGIPKSGINVSIEGNQLIVSGERWPDHKAQDNCKNLVNELRYGKFIRVIPLESSFDANQISASMDDGMLTLCWPLNSRLTTPDRLPIKHYHSHL